MKYADQNLPEYVNPFVDDQTDHWSAADLEWIDACPVCGCSKHELALSDLRDFNCHTVPGSWSLWRCLNCTARFLNPRLTENSILRAYETYPTHTQQSERRSSSRLVRTYRAIRDGRLSSKYGLPASQPTLPGWLAWFLPPFLRWEWDYNLRHLPKATPQKNRLLDVGCGNGSFMQLAKQAGWIVAGLDFDPSAVEEARNLGLSVQLGGLECLRPEDQYDCITLGHVIEHLHEPVAMLQKLETHLAPGGVIWIATPNANGPGYQRYGRHWGSLETPRHLAIFTRQALLECSDRAGLRPICWPRRGWNLALSFAQSANIRCRGDRLDHWRQQLQPSLVFLALLYETLAALRISGEDELVAIIGRKK